ncbi:serine/threonine-protein kinase [Nocardia sp. FBN12]|uniref:serine/threonine-protein kinase n=1 Tax=Nocardia sp. FBN12 TaxID=3419766 RepID=UPI003CFC22F4
MLQIGEVFAGFAIERLLGQGGMGAVYLAHHPRLPRRTALKLLNRDLFSDREVRTRFEREADLVAQLDHPNIVTVYDRGAEGDQLWISMQHIDGDDARTVSPRDLPAERAIQIIEGVAAALDYAHRKGIIHRDVKPANILLEHSEPGQQGRIFLADFGIARLHQESSRLTQTGTFNATLAFASPEQLTGATIDGRTDQYSLACSLYWLLTGAGPFDMAHPGEVIRGHLQLPPPSLSAARPGVSVAMDTTLAKGMAKHPDGRFASCTEFATAVRRALIEPSPAAEVTRVAEVRPTHESAPPQWNHAALSNNSAFPAEFRHWQSPGGGTPSPMTDFTSPRQPTRSAALVVGLAVAAVIALVAVGTLFAVTRDNRSSAATQASSSSPQTSSATSTASPASPTDRVAVHQAFPLLAPPNDEAFADGIAAHDKQRCYWRKQGDTLTVGLNSLSLTHTDWATAWDCSRDANRSTGTPGYFIIAYETPEAAAAALETTFAGNAKASEVNGGQTYTVYHRKTAVTQIWNHYATITSFESDLNRSRYVLYGYLGDRPEVGDSVVEGALMAWWNALPLS